MILPLPGQPVSVLDNFDEEIFPDIQSLSPLNQLEAIYYHTLWLGGIFFLTLLPRGDSSNQTLLRTSEIAGISSCCKPKIGLCSSGNSSVLLCAEGRSDFSCALPQPMGPWFAKLDIPSLPAPLCLLTQPATQSYRPGTALLMHS